MNYLEFLEQKKHTIGDFGFNPTFFPEIAFDFQNHVIEKAVKKKVFGTFNDRIVYAFGAAFGSLLGLIISKLIL